MRSRNCHTYFILLTYLLTYSLNGLGLGLGFDNVGLEPCDDDDDDGDASV